MKPTLMSLMFVLGFSSLAIAGEELNLKHLCEGKSPSIDKALVIVDKGFCAEYLKIETSNLVTGLDGVNHKDDPCPIWETKDKWKLRLYASHSFTTYFDTDITFSSTRYNVEIKNYEWAERSSREFFLPKTWKEEGNNPLQVIDEPTNTFVLSLEKNGHEFFLSAFHPKFLQKEGQVKYMKGNIDGTEVDGVAQINKPFDGYDQTPGESELVRNQNTHKQMTFEVGYGYRVKLFEGKFGNVTYVPSIGIGVMVGQNLSVMVKEGDWWTFEDHLDKYGVQGFGGSITNRLELNTKKERFGVFYENKLAYYHQEHGFLDGKQKYNLGFMGNNFGMKFMIYNPNNHSKSRSTPF